LPSASLDLLAFTGGPENGVALYVYGHALTLKSLISDLYVRILGRPSEANGIAYWTGQLVSGISPESVAWAFLRSREASMLAEERLYPHCAHIAGEAFFALAP
jgi:hypothetical protein